MQAIDSVTSSYTHNGLSNGQTYYYRLMAGNIAGQGTPSAEHSATPLAAQGTGSAIRAPLSGPLQSAALPVDGSLKGQIFVDGEPNPSAEKIHTIGLDTIEFLFDAPAGLHTFTVKYIFQDARWGEVELSSATSDALNIITGQVHNLVIADAAYTYPDNDNDGTSNLQEVANGTDPNSNDTTPPTTTANPTSGTYAPLAVNLNCDDGAGSGCRNTYVSTDTNASPSEFSLYSGPVNLNADTVLRFFSVDNAGNVAAVSSETYVIDVNGPVASCTDPLPNAVEVPVGSSISVEFSEQIDPNTLQPDGIVVVDEDANTMAGVITLDSNGILATFTPNTPLTMGTVYTAWVSSSIRDRVGNNAIETDCIFTSTSRKWAAIPNMPTGRSSPASGVINGQIYVAGGFTGSYTAVLEAYDVVAETWRTLAPMPTNRAYLGGAVAGGLFYAVGGLNSGSPMDTVEAYNPATNTWSSRQPMGVVRRDHQVVEHNGLLYAVGGQTINDESSAIEVYNPNTNTWTSKLSMPTPRARLGVAVLNDIIYAVGGEWNGQDLDVLEAYDIATNTWTTLAPMPTPRTGVRLAAANNRLYAMGGHDGAYLDITEVYNPATDTWVTTTIGAMNNPRYSASTNVLGNHVYMLGGAGGQTASAEVLILPPDEKIPPVAEYTVRDIPPDGVPDVFVGGSPPPKFLFVKLTEDRAILEFDIRSLPTQIRVAKLRIAMSTLDPGGGTGTMYMYTFDANGVPELKDFYAVGTPITIDGPNVSGNIPVSMDITASVMDARNRNVNFIGFMFRIATGSDRYDFETTAALEENRPYIEVFR